MLRAIVVMLALCAGAAQAQDIRWKFHLYPVGSYMTYRIGNAHFTHLLVGKEKPGVRVDVFEGKAPKGKVKTTYWLNGDGRSVRQVDHASGTTWEFRPHNCTRVVGTCRYTMTANGGAARQVTSTVMLEGKGFSYTVQEGGRLMSRGYSDLGANGMNVKGYNVDASGKRTDQQIVQVVPAK